MINIDKEFKKYANALAKEFYSDFKKFNLKNINEKQIVELKSLAPYLLEEENITSSKFVNYVKKIKRLVKEKKYEKYTLEEKYILFMFSVDPTLEALKIYGECNTLNQTKLKMGMFFGVYDSNLIKIEKEFIKKFFTEKEKKELTDEIDKRVFR